MQLQSKPLTNAWVTATWDDFLQLVEDSASAKAKAYYFNGQMRVETVGVGPDHARENTLIILAIGLICGLLGLPILGLTNCSYRKTGVREAQPDISYYMGDRAALAPQGSSIVNLDTVPPSDLAIEIADSSISENLGKKRLLYEEMQVAEYWVADVENAQVLAFQMIDGGSRRIAQSQVLSGFDLTLLTEALKLRQEMNDSQLVTWLMAKIQN